MTELALPPPNRNKRTATAVAIAIAIVAPAEGLRQRVYIDPVGIPTYCFGETRNPDRTRFYSLAECQGLLNDHVLDAANVVDKCVPNLPVGVLGAFSSAVYNMGSTIACNTSQSRAARLLKAGQYAQACDELPNWNHARVAGVLVALPGLTKRRTVERTACLDGLST